MVGYRCKSRTLVLIYYLRQRVNKILARQQLYAPTIVFTTGAATGISGLSWLSQPLCPCAAYLLHLTCPKVPMTTLRPSSVWSVIVHFDEEAEEHGYFEISL